MGRLYGRLKTRKQDNPNMLTFSKDKAAAVIAEALALNFYGKRKRDTKLEAAEDIIRALDLKAEAFDLVVWLEGQKPEKAEKEKKVASNKPASNTILNGHTERQALPVLYPDADVVIITAAQNNTAPHLAAWNALKQFVSDVAAELVVLPVYYNKNAFSSAVEDENERFDTAFTPYLLQEDSALFGDNIAHLYASAAVPATAKLPVNAASTLNNGELISIVSSPRQQLKTLVSSASMPIREAWATGCMTQINYTRSRAGSEAAAEHVFGAVMIIRDGDTYFARNLVYQNGVILDADLLPFENSNCVAVLGDLHCEVRDDDNWQKTVDWLDRLQPAEIVVHDILHFSTRSHHNRNSGDHLYRTKDQFVRADLLRVIEDLNTLAGIAPVYVCESNHNSSLDLWLHDIGYNPKRDPHQAKFYYLLNWLVCDAIDDNKENGQLALQVAFENLSKFGEFPELSDRVTFGRMDVSALRHGTDVSQHGHKGQNGSAGSTGLFSRWSFPMVTGHTHSPAIVGKVLTVGVTARLQQGYNRGGGSSWNQSHGLILPNGVRQIYPMRGLYL